MTALNECIMSGAKEALYNASVLYGFNYEESVQRCLMGEPCLGFGVLAPKVRECEVVSEKVVVQEVREVVVVAAQDNAVDVDVAYKKVTPKGKSKAKKVAEPTVEVVAVAAVEAVVQEAGEPENGGVSGSQEDEGSVKSKEARKRKPSPKDLREKAEREAKAAALKAEREEKEAALQEAKRVRAEALQAAKEAKEAKEAEEKAAKAAALQAAKEAKEAKEAALQADKEAKAAALQAAKDAKAAALQADKEAKAAALQAAKEAKEAALQADKEAKAAALQAAKEAKEAKEAEEKAAKAAALQASKKEVEAKPTAAKKASKKEVDAKPTAVEKPVAKKADKPASNKKTKEVEAKPVQAKPVQAKPVAVAKEVAAPSAEEEDEEEAVIDVKLFKWNGVSYLRSVEGVIYDVETNEALGVWNEKENKIDLDGPESEDELCATEIMPDSDDEGEGEGDDVEFGDELDGVCSAMGACAIVAETTAV